MDIEYVEWVSPLRVVCRKDSCVTHQGCLSYVDVNASFSLLVSNIDREVLTTPTSVERLKIQNPRDLELEQSV